MVVFYKTNRNLFYISKFYIQNANNFKIFPLVCSAEVSFTMGKSEFPMLKRVLEHLLLLILTIMSSCFPMRHSRTGSRLIQDVFLGLIGGNIASILWVFNLVYNYFLVEK